MAYIVMACIVMASIAMASIVMASYGLYSYGLYSYGLDLCQNISTLLRSLLTLGGKTLKTRHVQL
jgi:hypothetical protein